MLTSCACMLLMLVSAVARAQGTATAARALPDSATPAHTLRRYEIFPAGLLFPSLIASLKEPQLRNSLVRSHSSRDLNTLLGVTEQGASLALWRVNGNHRGDGFEFGIQGSASAQFDVESSRWTLLNADYMFSYPLTMRRGATAARFRYFHVSSHLGDRYLLLRPDARRFGNAGYRRESLEAVVAHTIGDSAQSALVYGGGEYAIGKTPHDMKPAVLRGGLDFTRRFHEFHTVARASWIAGTELTVTQERGWALGVSARAGYEIGRASGEAPGGRRYRMMVEYYGGPATFGHFSREDNVHYFGAGCYVII